MSLFSKKVKCSFKKEKSLWVKMTQKPSVSDLCPVCLVFPPLVSLYGLFPVLVSCHYEFIRFQVCVCYCVNYPVYLSPVC